MIALDTNVVVRLLVDDDPAQTRRARKRLEGVTALIVPTVLLETEWVLRGAYQIDRTGIAGSIRRLLGLPAIAASNAEAIAQALEWFESGLDFADALHLALAGEAEEFVTFDARLVKRARRISARKVAAV